MKLLVASDFIATQTGAFRQTSRTTLPGLAGTISPGVSPACLCLCCTRRSVLGNFPLSHMANRQNWPCLAPPVLFYKGVGEGVGGVFIFKKGEKKNPNTLQFCKTRIFMSGAICWYSHEWCSWCIPRMAGWTGGGLTTLISRWVLPLVWRVDEERLWNEAPD